PTPYCTPRESLHAPLSTPSLHDALPICQRIAQLVGDEHPRPRQRAGGPRRDREGRPPGGRRDPAYPPAHVEDRTPASTAGRQRRDRKSTRLNSSHGSISYAVFCLNKKQR